MTVAAAAALVLIALAAVLCLARLLRPASLPDRVIALDALLLCIVAGLAIAASGDPDAPYLDVLVVVALVGFVGTLAVARFIERRGS